LMILPPIDESLQDKLIILKAAKHPMPMPSVSDAEREVFMAALRAELPHFVDFLTKWQIPEHLVSQRYGITHYHHPEILEALGTFAPETRLLEMIETELFDSIAPGTWEGTAIQLERVLVSDNSKVAREARRLLSFPVACGTYLGRLQKLHPERFKSEHTRTGNKWTIDPPRTLNQPNYQNFRSSSLRLLYAHFGIKPILKSGPPLGECVLAKKVGRRSASTYAPMRS
jgi:hypothetical protein